MTLAICKNHCGYIYLLGDRSPQLIRLQNNLFSCINCKHKKFNLYPGNTDNELDKVIAVLPQSVKKNLHFHAYLDK